MHLGRSFAAHSSLPKQRGLSPVNGAIQDGSDAVITPAIRRSFQLPALFLTTILGYEQPRGTRWD